MAALAGLTGLYGELDLAPAGTVDEGSYQVLEQGTPDERHKSPGDTADQVWPAGYGLGYRGQGTYADNLSGQIAEYVDIPGGYVQTEPGALDETPSSHGGLYPVPMADTISTLNPDALSVVGDQLRALHGKEQGGTVAMLDAPGGHEETWHISVDRYDAPNENGLRKAEGQLRSLSGGLGGMGGGSHLGQADVDQGYGELNSNEEFRAGHSIRVVQHDSALFDYTGLRSDGEEGTWLGKHPVGTPQSFDGPDSPYGSQGEMRTGMMRAEVRGFPTEYQNPVAPTVLPVTPGTQVDVWASAAF